MLSRAAKQSLCSAGQLEDTDESDDKEERKGSGLCGGKKKKEKRKKRSPYSRKRTEGVRQRPIASTE